MNNEKDVSVILPFYKRYRQFAFALKYYNQNHFSNCELIIVLDEPSEKNRVCKLLSEVKAQAVVIVNELDHPWRNPSCAINVGIRFSRSDYIAVFSPETLLISDVIYDLKSRCTGDSYAIGRVKFSTYEEIYVKSQTYSDNLFMALAVPEMYYGSICFKRKHAYDIGGYDESFQNWGGDDDNFRIRLKQYGITENRVATDLIHPDERGGRRINIRSTYTSNAFESIYRPKTFVANNRIFGESFNKVIYDTRC